MKKLIVVLALCFFLTACAHSLVVGDQVYQPYGGFNAASVKAPDVMYQPSWGNITLGVVGCLFPPFGFIAPIYFWGFSAMEPVGVK